MREGESIDGNGRVTRMVDLEGLQINIQRKKQSKNDTMGIGH